MRKKEKALRTGIQQCKAKKRNKKSVTETKVKVKYSTLLTVYWIIRKLDFNELTENELDEIDHVKGILKI